jgi:hypothetical protein
MDRHWGVPVRDRVEGGMGGGNCFISCPHSLTLTAQLLLSLMIPTVAPTSGTEGQPSLLVCEEAGVTTQVSRRGVSTRAGGAEGKLRSVAGLLKRRGPCPPRLGGDGA